MQQQAASSFDVRPLTLSDLPVVAHIHLQAFPDSALTKLGREAVRRYYEWQMLGPHDALNIGVFVQEELLGFCFSGKFRGALGGFLDKNRSFLAQRVATHPWLLLNPLFRERAQFAFSRLAKRIWPRRNLPSLKQASPKQARVRSFGILSIAVAPQHRGSGAAQCLMEYSERVALERGFTRMGLSVHPSNGRAVHFYEKVGWQRDTKNGIWDGRMSKVIGSPQDPDEVSVQDD